MKLNHDELRSSLAMITSWRRYGTATSLTLWMHVYSSIPGSIENPPVYTYSKNGGRRRRGLLQDGGGDGGRGLHSFTSQLNLSALYGIGCAQRGCLARVEGVLEGV